MWGCKSGREREAEAPEVGVPTQLGGFGPLAHLATGRALMHNK
jgi:hypothetical protein